MALPEPVALHRRAAAARSLVIPMKDEAGRIESTLRAVAASGLHRPDTELVLVDDGSVDGTPDVAERLLGELDLRGAVVRLGRNLGKGGAVRAGVAAAQGTTVAFADADLSAPPEAVLACFELVEQGRGDVVVTTRLHPDSKIIEKPPLSRRWSGKVFNTLLRRLGLTSRADTQCGLKAFTGDAARLLFQDLRIQRFAFDVEVLLRAELADLRVVELPIEWRHVDASRVRPLRDGARMAVDVIRLRRSLRAWSPQVAGAPAMDHERFPVMARLEREHWWFRAKRDLVAAEVHRLDRGRDRGPAADVGCGTGAMVATLEALGFRPVVGTDASRAALHFALDEHGGRGELAAATAERLPFADASFGCLTSLDVVEHLDDDVAALREYGRVVRPGGAVLVAVPAYRWAWSDHDVALGHRRRYTASQLARSAVAAGLRVERVTYYHSWLVPLAFLLRRTPLRLLLRGSAEEASFVSPGVNRLLVAVSAVERWVAARVAVPFGLSILLVARRPDGR